MNALLPAYNPCCSLCMSVSFCHVNVVLFLMAPRCSRWGRISGYLGCFQWVIDSASEHLDKHTFAHLCEYFIWGLQGHMVTGVGWEREEQWEREERNGKKQGKGEEGQMETEGKKGMAGGAEEELEPWRDSGSSSWPEMLIQRFNKSMPLEKYNVSPHWVDVRGLRKCIRKYFTLRGNNVLIYNSSPYTLGLSICVSDLTS